MACYRIAAADARKEFANVVRRSAKGERIKLTRYDKTVAVLIPTRDLARLEECEEEPPPRGQDGRERGHGTRRRR
jgi:prevent-host-death family protein